MVTGISTAAVSGSAAIAGAILSRKFGHGVKTDGFFAAYSVYLALVLVANALRVVLLPRFARAEESGLLGREVSTWFLALAIPLAPLAAVALAAPHLAAEALTSGPRVQYAAQLLPWLVPAAAAQALAGAAASALAALDDYGTAAFGFAAGGVAGLVLIVVLIPHGVVAFGWGLAVNAAVALGVPLAVLVRRRAPELPARDVWRRLGELAEGVALPFALQGLFVIATRFAQGMGTGPATIFSYAYLIASFLVAVTATSVALVSSVPLARGTLTPGVAVRHVVSASWLSLAVVAGAAGVFALAGERIARGILGPAYGGGAGSELGRLVAYFAPWMAISIAVSVTFPLLFVRGRARWLPALAVGALLVHVLVEWGGRAAFGLAGLAGGLALTTGVVLAALLWSLGALVDATRGLLIAAVVCAAVAVAAFGLPGIVLGAIPAAAVGAVIYGAAVLGWRPAGLRNAWAYARALQ